MQRVWRSASGLYHVSARGTGKQLIFENDDDRWEFLDLMRDCCRDKGVTILAWCLMGNHVHLVLADYEDGMSAAMQRLLLTYARRFNKRTGRTGHLFQNRFDRRSLDDDRHLMAAIRYVHANPQEAGICPLEQYKWSSFSEYLRAYDGEGPLGFSSPSTVLDLFGSSKSFIAYSLAIYDGPDPMFHSLDQTEWERRVYADNLAKKLGVPLDKLKTVPPAQRDGIIYALHDSGYTVREIERYTGISKSTVSRIVRAFSLVKEQAGCLD